MMPRINSAQAKDAAALLKDIIIDYYRNPNNMAAYIEWLHTQSSSDCVAELKRLTQIEVVQTIDFQINQGA